MALIKCPGCGREVEDSTGKCPECGFLFNEQIFHAGQNEDDTADSEDLSPEDVQIMKKNFMITGIHFAAVCIAALTVALIDKDYVIIGLPLGVIGGTFIICMIFNLWDWFGKVFRIVCILGIMICAAGFIIPRL